jgi:hypothetical protein
MIVKISEFYFDTELSEERVQSLIGSLLQAHYQEHEDLDLDIFLDVVEENEAFEAAPDENAADVEFSEGFMESILADIAAEHEYDLRDDDYEEEPY